MGLSWAGPDVSISVSFCSSMEIMGLLSVRSEEKTKKERSETTMNIPTNDSKDSGNVTVQENVTWVDVVKDKTKFQKNDRSAILLKQSNSKKI